MPRWVSTITPHPSKNTFAGGYVEFPLFPVVPFGLLASRVFNSSSTWPFSGSTARPGARVCMHTNSTRGQALGISPCNRDDFKSSFLGVCNAEESVDLLSLPQAHVAVPVAFAARCRIAHFQQTISNSLFTAQKLLRASTTPF